MSTETSYRPDMPDFGAYTRWPIPGTDWIHPDDVELAEQLIPSRRVFHRLSFDSPFYTLRYGHFHLRVMPAMWQTVPAIDLQVGDQVEMLSCLGQHEAGIARVRELMFDFIHAQYEIFLRRGEIDLPEPVQREQLALLTTHPQLHDGHFNHLASRLDASGDLEYLDVGDLLDH